MADYLANRYFAPRFFNGAYFGGGETPEGSISAALVGSGALSGDLTATGQAATDTHDGATLYISAAERKRLDRARKRREQELAALEAEKASDRDDLRRLIAKAVKPEPVVKRVEVAEIATEFVEVPQEATRTPALTVYRAPELFVVPPILPFAVKKPPVEDDDEDALFVLLAA